MGIAEALFLNLWPLGNLNEILIKQVPANIMNWWLMYLLWNYPQVDDFTDIGSGSGLVLSGNKPLPEPMLTHNFTSIWCH